MFIERNKSINAYHLLVSLFSSFTSSVVCHTLPLTMFGKSPLGIISFMVPSLALCLCFLFQFCLLLRWSLPCTISRLWNQPWCTPVLATIRGCGTNFIVFLYKAWRKCAHTYIYILLLLLLLYYIHTTIGASLQR